MSDGSTCPACGADAVDASGVCGRCGYAQGAKNTCPHCGAIARTEPKDGRWVCAVCGGPRIPGNLGGDDATGPLREAKAFLGTRARANAASVAWGILAALATLVVVAATAKAAIATTAVLAVLAIIPALLAVRARGRAGKAAEQAKSAEDRAWLAAAEDAAKNAKDGITAAELGKRLGIGPERADELLTQLAVHDRTRIDVGDDAQVRYSATPEVRIGDDEPLEEATDESKKRQST